MSVESAEKKHKFIHLDTNLDIIQLFCLRMVKARQAQSRALSLNECTVRLTLCKPNESTE
jgi:hypothetical protein